MDVQRALCPAVIERDEELSLLEGALMAARSGSGTAVMLAREAGLGKTRLAMEMRRQASRAGMAVLWGGCSGADLALPYLPFMEAIGNFLAAADLEWLSSKLGPFRRDLARLFPQLGPDDLPAETGEAPYRKVRLFEGILALLRIAAAGRGLLLVVEDMHWADSSTRELFDYTVRRLHGNSVMALATYRSDQVSSKHPLLPLVQGWRRSGLVRICELKPLTRAGVSEMVQAIFDQPFGGELGAFLFARSEGNPFVLEELIKVSLERGDIYRSDAGWEGRMPADLALPSTVRDLILLRLARLADDELEIVRRASVLGTSFSYPMLVRICAGDEPLVQAALRTSGLEQLIVEEPGDPGRYRFRHAVTREAVYQDMLTPRRRELHTIAASALRDMPQIPPVELAHHLLAAGSWHAAVPVCIKAAEDAERLRGYREAAELYARALPHVTDKLIRGQVLCRMGSMYLLANEPGKAQPRLEEGVRLLDESSQLREGARYRLRLGRCYWLRSRPDLARANYDISRTVLEPEGPSEDLATAYLLLSTLHAFQYEFAESLAMGHRAIAVAEAAGTATPRIWADTYVGVALGNLGRVDEGLIYLDRSYREAVAGGLDWIAETAAVNSAIILWLQFRAEEALSRVQLLRSLDIDSRRREFWIAYVEGTVLQALGEPLKARRALEVGLGLARNAGNSTMVGWLERDLAWASAACGRLDEARRLLPALGGQPERQSALRLLVTRLRVLLDAGKPDLAAEEAGAALQIVNWQGQLQPREVLLLDYAVDAFLQSGRTAAAEEMVARLQAAAGAADPYRRRLEGRLALASGRLEESREHLSAAANFLRAAGYREEGWRTTRLLAEVLVRLGDKSGAAAELVALVSEAGPRGAAFEAEAAARHLSELGVRVAVGAGVEPPPEAPVAAVRQPEERLVTVLFVDVRGYSELAGRRPPQEVVEKIAALYRLARLEVERHHGTVDKFAGDAVMAIFNVSGMRLDHCRHAMESAVAIARRAALAGLEVGIGIAVGPAIVGQLTAEAGLTAIGETTNLAARLEEQAAAGECLLNSEAYRRLSEWLAEQGIAAAEQTLGLKGFAEPLRAYRLRTGVSESVAR